MTAFASLTGRDDRFGWTWELRGVNGRGLDLRLRLPDSLTGLDQKVRTALSAVLSRGSVTVGLRVTEGDGPGDLALDTDHLDRVLAAIGRIEQRAQDAGITLTSPTPADILQIRGVQLSASREGGPDPDAVFADFERALADFRAMRRGEGKAIAAMLTAQLDDIARLTDAAAAAAADRTPAQKAQLADALRRVQDSADDTDPQRIAQELALIAVRSDVTEEIDRLRAHVAAARELVATDGAVGRKLDFLAQEFNREANTLCSKAGHPPLTAVGLDLKAAIDQMREQIQNVE